MHVADAIFIFDRHFLIININVEDCPYWLTALGRGIRSLSVRDAQQVFAEVVIWRDHSDII